MIPPLVSRLEPVAKRSVKKANCSSFEQQGVGFADGINEQHSPARVATPAALTSFGAAWRGEFWLLA
ncbi:MAG: hypothetical protein RRB13_15050 [bacterium]|nr:hypothetical protein [bacterium]